ncbi:MAG TPA: hypothetical protein VE422_30535 [Terriglobia bacterium]|nr:hypothetical protein [Terriglobia bacterium]
MKNPTKSKQDIELASKFTVADYEKARDAKVPDRDAIAKAIHRRFLERYIEPVLQPKKKHGFAIMAVSCLIIETLVSFRRGWKHSRGKSEDAFRRFFKCADSFSAFREHSKDFYENVRCGILHQAETTGGWLILRDGPLLDPRADTITINATEFIKQLEKFLEKFCEDLKSKDWDSTEWKNVIIKMNVIVKNCEP